MDAHQSVVSPPLKSSSVVSDLERQKSGNLSEESGVLGKKESMVRSNTEGFMGVLEVYIHQARDIHNICIYQKQDVYAKLCLMSDPENTTVSTKIINGGGKNPVFDESFKLNVGTIESSLKCEVWMLSRVKNYLGDQLLGFALVPLSEILVGNGRVAQEFSLSSNDMFHSPAGVVELSLAYTGASPEVMAIPDPRRSPSVKATALQEGDYEVTDSISSNYDKIEFPDPKIVNENEMMVSEYFGIQSPTLDTESSESLDNSETTHNSHGSDNGVRVMDCFSAANLDPIEVPKRDTPASSVSTNGSPSASLSASSQSFCDTPDASKSNSDLVSATKEKNVDVAGTGTETETDTSSKAPSNTFAQSVLNVNMEQENLVVQQDIVDMYMKSMQQFTESLAKMKLPLDIENRTTTTNSENENSSSDQKLQASKAKDSKVFYGSRPFF